MLDLRAYTRAHLASSCLVMTQTGLQRRVSRGGFVDGVQMDIADLVPVPRPSAPWGTKPRRQAPRGSTREHRRTGSYTKRAQRPAQSGASGGRQTHRGLRSGEEVGGQALPAPMGTWRLFGGLLVLFLLPHLARHLRHHA